MKYLWPLQLSASPSVRSVSLISPTDHEPCARRACWPACSTEKDAFLNRTFHRLTARDNGWFNANEKLKEVVAGMEEAYLEDYDEVLPIFVYGTEEQAQGRHPRTGEVHREVLASSSTGTPWTSRTRRRTSGSTTPTW